VQNPLFVTLSIRILGLYILLDYTDYLHK